MAAEIKASAKSSKQKKRMTWSKEVRANDITERVSVEELDNGGYLVIINRYGEVNGKYTDETKKMFSKVNPLEPDEEPVEEKIFNALVRTVK